VESTEHCCICGGERGAAYCDWCGHAFCENHRSFWRLRGIWQRGVAAVKEWIGQNGGTPHCQGHGGVHASGQ